MIGFDIQEKKELFKNITCYIKNKIDEMEIENSEVSFILYAADTIIHRFKILNNNKAEVKTFLDTLYTHILKFRHSHLTFFSSSYITLGILASYKLQQIYDATSIKELYLFTDGDFIIPQGTLYPIFFPNLIDSLKQFQLTQDDLRYFFYFPLYSKPDPTINQIVQLEGGQIFNDFENNLCTESKYDSIYFLIKVLDDNLLPLDSVQIISNKNSKKYFTNKNGIATINLKIQIPTFISLKFIKASKKDNFLNFFITPENYKKEYKVSVMLQPVPLSFKFNYELKKCSVYTITNSDTQKSYIDSSYKIIKFYRYDDSLTNLKFILKNVNKSDSIIKDTAIRLNKWQNFYEINVKKGDINK